MSEADFGLTNKGSHAPDGAAPQMVMPIDGGMPMGMNPGMGDLKHTPDRVDNSAAVGGPNSSIVLN
jgi:hypothetical protein